MRLPWQWIPKNKPRFNISEMFTEKKFLENVKVIGLPLCSAKNIWGDWGTPGIP